MVRARFDEAWKSSRNRSRADPGSSLLWRQPALLRDVDLDVACASKAACETVQKELCDGGESSSSIGAGRTMIASIRLMTRAGSAERIPSD